MSHTLLDAYARLITTDTEACADLFSNDAEYLTRLGSHQLSFKGRADIRGFLQHVPRQIAFRAAHCVPEGNGYAGALRLSASDLEPRQQHVRFSVEAGRFKRFEILSFP
ncbi:MAG: hypothetical protein JNL28_08580 [Planctomycetes bacterium]|nr:hypothetical protein [Planctomycetota bacterium]